MNMQRPLHPTSHSGFSFLSLLFRSYRFLIPVILMSDDFYMSDVTVHFLLLTTSSLLRTFSFGWFCVFSILAIVGFSRVPTIAMYLSTDRLVYCIE
ncbi:hypothetical protein BJX68DRAFT_46814 [Aspergillus pseudodeflectus]|uniref:Uncharacterized protein n=1 Tax=Aspergillus pseudodeflectus TaxID=176178 RepID=A0ABR4KN97_9EURO